jgi:hypothetical protein
MHYKHQFLGLGEAEVRGLWSEASQGKVGARPYLKNKLKAKGQSGWVITQVVKHF